MHALFPPRIFLEYNLFITAYLFRERRNKRIMFFGLPGRVVKLRWKRYSRTMLIESPKKKEKKTQDLIRVKDDAHSKLIPKVFPRVQ